MSRSFLFAFAFSLLAAPLVAQQQPAPRSEVADRIMAVVGDSIILKSDVDLELLQMGRSGVPIPDTAVAIRKIVDRRVGELVLLQAAIRDTALKVTPEELNSEVQKELDARRRQFASEQQFQQALASAGMTIDELRRSISDEVGGRVLLRQYVQKVSKDRHAPPVTDDDIKKYFEANRAAFGQRPATITFSQLVIAPKASDSARAVARKKIEEVAQKIREGGDFEALAKQYSEDPGSREKGGDLGWFRSGTMVREFEDVAFALRPGDVSTIVETPFGFHIIKVEKIRGAERQARHILVVPQITQADIDRTRAYADSLIEKIKAGASLDSMITKIGDPAERDESHIGPYARDRLPEPYKTSLTDAVAGTVAGPLELAGTAGASKFAIVKVTDTKPAGDFSLADPAFRNDLRNTLEQNAMIDELVRDLKRRTLVEYRF